MDVSGLNSVVPISASQQKSTFVRHTDSSTKQTFLHDLSDESSSSPHPKLNNSLFKTERRLYLRREGHGGWLKPPGRITGVSGWLQG